MTRALALAAGLLLAAAPAGAEPFLDLYGGRSDTRPADLRIRQPAHGRDVRVAEVPFDDESFESPVYYGVRAGVFPARAPWLGVAVEFVHFKLFADPGAVRPVSGQAAGAPLSGSAPVGSVVQAFGISHGVNYLTVDLLFRRPVLRPAGRGAAGRVELHAGLGAGPVVAHPENTVFGERNDERYELAGAGVQLLAGARLRLARRAGLLVEYKFTAADLEVGVAGGEARLRERTHHLVAGAALRFP